MKNIKDKNLAKIDINEQFKEVLQRIESGGGPLFVTGKAGTGKSTLLHHFRLNTNKQVAVVAPTGVAALNVGGQTIHSFFGFSPNVTPIEIRRGKKAGKLAKILTKMDILVVDEVSMVRADLMDCIDEACRYYLDNEQPFGGKQVVFFGDLYQLPPVLSNPDEKHIFSNIYRSPYFFDAKVFSYTKIDIIELTKIYRQSNKDFVDILNQIRHNTIGHEGITKLNKCYQPNSIDYDDGYITLTTTNHAAGELNLRKLSQLPGQIKEYDGLIEGNFSDRTLPTEEKLQLKVGAQVMLLNNDSMGRWVNGSMGRIDKIKTENGKDQLLVKIYGGQKVEVLPYTWSVNRYYFDPTSRSLEMDTIGTFTQYPLRLAWAVTIHKSQGKTFEKVVVDLGRGAFSPGQVYVAISRCTSMDGLVLKRPMDRRSIWTDQRIVDFMTDYQKGDLPKIMTLGRKISLIQKAIANGDNLKVIFLQPDKTEIEVNIKPRMVSQVNQSGKNIIAVEADCEGIKKQIRIDRILSIF